MKISVLCSDRKHPIQGKLRSWVEARSAAHQVQLVEKSSDLSGGVILFLISCHEMIRPAVRESYCKTLVIHASDLPQGRGWSPHIWSVLEGKSELTVSLLEAQEPVDSGPVWTKEKVPLEGHELYDEINEKLFNCELRLMDFAVEQFDKVVPQQQDNAAATTYRRRKPEDSRVDLNSSLAEQFNLLRVADPERYPAFFEFQGHRYEIQLRKAKS
jgi:methionyl-tRNA formyltransferase